MDGTRIGWCDATWNVVRGCTEVSPGCANCYAKGTAARFSGPGLAYEGLARFVSRPAPGGGVRKLAMWNDTARVVEEMMEVPYHWRRPRRIFVNSMSDLFHKDITDQQIEDIFGVMAMCPWHQFLILTKRPERMLDWFSGRTGPRAMNVSGSAFRRFGRSPSGVWPLANVVIGVTAEDQKRANERLPLLLRTPAAKRMVSVEPQLERVSLRPWLDHVTCRACDWTGNRGMATVYRGSIECPRCIRKAHVGLLERGPRIDQVIVGAESGLGARPFDEMWARVLRDECRSHEVSFFYKQTVDERGHKNEEPTIDGRLYKEMIPLPKLRAA